MSPFALEPLEPRQLLADHSILFIRGAERSGGFLEATNDAARTEQLADINNASTANGNHGWKELADLLRRNGYAVEQMAEPLETNAPDTGQTQGAPLPFDMIDLSEYDVIVLGSNNARYTPAQVDAVEAYVRGGGAVLFISDGNFGSDWADAPTSDQAFLDRFGWSVNQDNGTYVLDRADDFTAADHPVFGGVDHFDGEGVSPIHFTGDTKAGVTTTPLAKAKGQTRNNDAANGGTLRDVQAADHSLIVATVDQGRIAGLFDRNTFFNQNGAGTDLSRFDNGQLALNLFGWLAEAGDADTVDPRAYVPVGPLQYGAPAYHPGPPQLRPDPRVRPLPGTFSSAAITTLLAASATPGLWSAVDEITDGL